MSHESEALLKVYQEGSKRFNDELNVDLLLKHVRMMNILMDKQFSGKQLNFEIAHDRKNIINLDSLDSHDENDFNQA